MNTRWFCQNIIMRQRKPKMLSKFFIYDGPLPHHDQAHGFQGKGNAYKPEYSLEFSENHVSGKERLNCVLKLHQYLVPSIKLETVMITRLKRDKKLNTSKTCLPDSFL